jgi:hypothetical protein
MHAKGRYLCRCCLHFDGKLRNTFSLIKRRLFLQYLHIITIVLFSFIKQNFMTEMKKGEKEKISGKKPGELKKNAL